MQSPCARVSTGRLGCACVLFLGRTSAKGAPPRGMFRSAADFSRTAASVFLKLLLCGTPIGPNCW